MWDAGRRDQAEAHYAEALALLQHAVERAIQEAAPEIVTIDVEDPGELPAPGSAPVPVVLGRKPA